MTTCALVAASDFSNERFCADCAILGFSCIIAVDGGYGHLRNAGIVPNLAMGDFDSLGFVPTDCEVREYPAHKDQSDLEIALEFAMAEGFDVLYVYGAMGGRLDHTLANIQLLAHYAEAGLTVTAVTDQGRLRYLVGPAIFDLPLLPQGTVSVFSLVSEAVGVTERGLEYPLDDAVLSDRTTWGLSNELIGEPASVSVEEGTIVVFYPFDDAAKGA